MTFDENLRRCGANRAAFEEAPDTRLKKIEALHLDTARPYSRRIDALVTRIEPSQPIGHGDTGSVKMLNSTPFNFDRNSKVWRGIVKTDVVEILPDCPEADAADWIESLWAADYDVEHTTHILGRKQENPRHVALADPSNRIVTWFLHPSGNLHATAIQKSTAEDMKPVETRRIILHELLHLREPEMKPWLDRLTEDISVIAKNEDPEQMKGFAKYLEQLNGEFLVPLFQQWKARNEEQRTSTDPRVKKELFALTEALAAEVLVESFIAHIVDRDAGAPSPERWDTLNYLIHDMKQVATGEVQEPTLDPSRN